MPAVKCRGQTFSEPRSVTVEASRLTEEYYRPLLTLGLLLGMAGSPIRRRCAIGPCAFPFGQLIERCEHETRITEITVPFELLRTTLQKTVRLIR